MDEFTERAIELSQAVAEGRMTEEEWGVAMDELSSEFGMNVEVF